MATQTQTTVVELNPEDLKGRIISIIRKGASGKDPTYGEIERNLSNMGINCPLDELANALNTLKQRGVVDMSLERGSGDDITPRFYPTYRGPNQVPLGICTHYPIDYHQGEDPRP